MIKHSTDALLFFEGRELSITAYGVARLDRGMLTKTVLGFDYPLLSNR